MEDNDWFDVMSHVFIFFPIAVLWKPFNFWDKITFALLVVVLIFSIIHHVVSTNVIFRIIDQAWVGIFIIFIVFIYIDKIFQRDAQNSQAAKKTPLCKVRCTCISDNLPYIFVAFLVGLHALGIYGDYVNDEDDGDIGDIGGDEKWLWTTTTSSAVILVIGFAYFWWYRKKGVNKKMLYSAMFYAVLAGFFFVIDADNFYTHSLWHVYAFTATGFAILMVTDEPKKQGPSQPRQEESEETCEKKNKKIFYALSLTTRAYYVALYWYGGYLAEKIFAHELWSVYALLTGVMFFVVALRYWKLEQSNQNKKKVAGTQRGIQPWEMSVHAFLWLSAGICFQLLYNTDGWWVAGLLLTLDLLFSVCKNWQKVQAIFVATGKALKCRVKRSDVPVAASNPKVGYTDVEIPQRYRKNTLRF